MKKKRERLGNHWDNSSWKFCTTPFDPYREEEYKQNLVEISPRSRRQVFYQFLDDTMALESPIYSLKKVVQDSNKEMMGKK